MVDSLQETRSWSWSQRIQSLWDEIQRSLSWTWLLPFVVIALSLVLARATTPISSNSDTTGSTSTEQHTSSSEVTKPKQKPTRTATTPDYASEMRNDLELYIPLISIFLAVPLLAKEWQYGTVVPLAMRKSLGRVLLERLGIILLYLLIIISVTAMISLWMTVQPPDNGAIGPWVWDVIRTIGPTTLFCTALALLVAIATVSAVAGYMAVVGIWSINLLCSQMLVPPQGQGSASDFLLYTFNSWRIHDQVVHPDQWWVGKVIWLVGGILCLLGSFFLLRYEARLIRNMAE